MKEALKNIIELPDIEAVFYIGKNNDHIVHISDNYKKTFSDRKIPDAEELEILLKNLDGLTEAEFIFSEKRLFIRKIENCFLMIVLGFSTPSPILQLNCDIAIPELNKSSKPKGLSRFFKK